jgi:hypothetical protein
VHEKFRSTIHHCEGRERYPERYDCHCTEVFVAWQSSCKSAKDLYDLFFHPRGTVFAFKFILTANWPASMGDNTFLRHFACRMHVVLTPGLEILESL